MSHIPRSRIGDLARTSQFTVDDDDMDEFMILVDSILDQLDEFDVPSDQGVAPVPASRDGGHRPTPADDPLNAVVHWCSVTTGAAGPLTGRRVALKDNIFVAGLPCTHGSELLATFTPRSDAVITQRLLLAGAEIVAKTNQDSFAWSGSGETSDYGPTRNPFDRDRTAGGSSGGSAAVLHYDSVDVSFGTDQGGSIRIPAAWCGVLGMKPTYGLVPYSGVVPVDLGYDHAGPLGRTAMDVALALQVVAGQHANDPRQWDLPVEHYVGAVANAPERLDGVRVGVVREGFVTEDVGDRREGTAATMQAVREAMQRLRTIGAQVAEISIPEHVDARTQLLAALCEGVATTINSHAGGHMLADPPGDALHVALERALERGSQLPWSLKSALVVGNHLRDQYFGAVSSGARTRVASIRSALDRALDAHDVLALPTAMHYPHKLHSDGSLSQQVLRGYVGRNTAATNVSGHPAISLPAACADGLPVGLMLIGKHFNDARLLAVARTYEMNYGWRPRPADVSSA